MVNADCRCRRGRFCSSVVAGAHFVRLHNMQNALCNLDRVRIAVKLGLGSGPPLGLWLGLGLKLGSALGQKFINCTHAISNLCSAFLQFAQIDKFRATLSLAWCVCVYVCVQLLLKAGGDNRQTAFLFSDSQIKDESFMEDISMILNTGDVPNLYAADEKAEIIEKMQNVARSEVSPCRPADVLFPREN